MAPAPPNENTKRFHLLPDKRPQRKKTTNSDVPGLSIDKSPIDKEYVVISSTDAKVIVAQLGPFAIKKPRFFAKGIYLFSVVIRTRPRTS